MNNLPESKDKIILNMNELIFRGTFILILFTSTATHA